MVIISCRYHEKTGIKPLVYILNRSESDDNVESFSTQLFIRDISLAPIFIQPYAIRWCYAVRLHLTLTKRCMLNQCSVLHVSKQRIAQT